MVFTCTILFTRDFFPSQTEEMTHGLCLINHKKILLIDKQTGHKYTVTPNKPPVLLTWREETDLLMIEEAKEAFFIATPLIHLPHIGLTLFRPYLLSRLKKSIEACTSEDDTTPLSNLF